MDAKAILPKLCKRISVMDFVMHATDEDNAGRLEITGPQGSLMKKLKDFFVK